MSHTLRLPNLPEEYTILRYCESFGFARKFDSHNSDTRGIEFIFSPWQFFWACWKIFLRTMAHLGSHSVTWLRQWRRNSPITFDSFPRAWVSWRKNFPLGPMFCLPFPVSKNIEIRIRRDLRFRTRKNIRANWSTSLGRGRILRRKKRWCKMPQRKSRLRTNVLCNFKIEFQLNFISIRSRCERVPITILRRIAYLLKMGIGWRWL